MSGILDSVNQRTQLVGQNRLELLLFRLNGRQRFGINVFKVREVLQCPPLTAMPKLNPLVRGVAHIRGQTISVIDLSMATRGRKIEDLSNAFIVIAEYNRSVQGFLVGAVERIINTNWDAIMPPPQGTGRASYLTAVTEVENELIEILDVEKILNEISDEKIASLRLKISSDEYKKEIYNQTKNEAILKNVFSINIFNDLSETLKKEIIQFTASDLMIKTATKYLGVYPILRGIYSVSYTHLTLPTKA